ncbi:MAG: hypothetical protein A2138_03735 [Deltaproteobacteria bacterium RBG_16_71_12]|nr:MAG: hypothetical protein A2138_03735 [Deltaproteobacteria bacterium RBG_16_71_12]
MLAALVVALVVAELLERPLLRGLFKTAASLTFVGAGALFLPLQAATGRLLFAGLVLSLIGDVALIAKGRKALFLLGLASFLIAHLCYAAAFAAFGQEAGVAVAAASAALVLGLGIGRWLAPHVRGSMRAPVALYVAAISTMVALAAGAYGAAARPTLLVGAVLFYLSDLCVARERFVARSRWNGVIGLPLYYAAQLNLVDGLQEPGP